MPAARPAAKSGRMSTGKTPKSIVFIQCVGSRDMTIGKPYCSCVCCMQAIKNAILIKEKDPAIDVTICYMDIRSYGKGYEEYYERAKALGIRFLRGMPSDILADRKRPDPAGRELRDRGSARAAPGPRGALGRHGTGRIAWKNWPKGWEYRSKRPDL